MPTSNSLICVVDDDPLIRKTIEAILLQDGYDVKSYDSGTSFLSALAGRVSDSQVSNGVQFDCILLDVKMPDMSGLEVLQRLEDFTTLPPIIMISGQGDISTAVKSMRTGASDFIEKPFTTDQLLAAVEQAIQAAEPPALATSIHPELAGLSARELEVLELLVNGDANKVIAYKLGISQRTVEVHRARIMDRMEVKTFADLVRKAIVAGL